MFTSLMKLWHCLQESDYFLQWCLLSAASSVCWVWLLASIGMCTCCLTGLMTSASIAMGSKGQEFIMLPSLPKMPASTCLEPGVHIHTAHNYILKGYGWETRKCVHFKRGGNYSWQTVTAFSSPWETIKTSPLHHAEANAEHLAN